MFLRESDRRSYGMCRYSVSLITAGACNASFSECSMCPLCSSMRATPLKIITTARRSVHTLIGSKEALRTKTRAFMIEADITRPRQRVSKLSRPQALDLRNQKVPPGWERGRPRRERDRPRWEGDVRGPRAG